MQARQKHNKKTVLLSVICFGLITFGGIFVFAHSNTIGSKASICNTSQYSRVQSGMTKQQIIELWGEPATKRVKDSADQNFFYQGTDEANIKEGWTYRNEQPYAAEVYFDNSGLVKGKNCGQG